ncbi:MAG: hypothetical protein GQ477_05640 [Nanohaloarchaea archaeon]|nr:hypothetical protein [Candidatus Nanohaloarchaea archaeon]
MKQVNIKRYILYLARWQLSTPILALVLIWLSTTDRWTATIIANLIGGLIFFWVDRYIFTTDTLDAQWEIKDKIRCTDCNKVSRGYRLVKTENYDRTDDKIPKFRCERCSKKKTEILKQNGIKIK